MNKRPFKQSARLKITVFFLLLLVINALPVLNSCTKKFVEIKDIILSKNVDANGNPTEATDLFPSETKEIFLVIKVNNMKTTDNLTAKWTFLDKNVEIDNKTFVPEKSFTGNHVFRIKIAQGFPFGNYEVNVFLNGNLIKTLPFKVS